MEFYNEGVTVADNISQLNETFDWAFWRNAKIDVSSPDCTRYKWLFFNRSKIILHSYSEMLQAESLCDVIDTLRFVVFFTVISIGIPGNILALLTILQLPRTTSTFYVAMLSGFDLVQVLIKGLEASLNYFKLTTSAGCKILSFITNFTGTYANWILVLICFERFFTIRFPLKKRYYFTLRRAQMSAVILALVLLPAFIPHLWLLDEKGDTCFFADPYKEFFETIWVYFEIGLYVFLPALLLFLMVILIAIELKKVQRTRKYIFGGSEETGGGMSNDMAQRQLREQAKTERTITVMLFFAAITFIVLCLPICIVLPLYFINRDNFKRSPLRYAQWQLAYKVCLALIFLSHAVNIFVYFLSAGKFRSQMFQLLRSKCCKTSRKSNSHDHTLHTMMNERDGSD